MSESPGNSDIFSLAISLLRWRPWEGVQGHARGDGAGLDRGVRWPCRFFPHSSQPVCLPPPTHKQFLLASHSKHSWSLTTSRPPSLSPRWLLGLPHWPPTAFLVPVMSPLHTAGVVILLTYTRKESKKRTNACICVTGSLCWAPGTNTLSINYTPISFFFFLNKKGKEKKTIGQTLSLLSSDLPVASDLPQNKIPGLPEVIKPSHSLLSDVPHLTLLLDCVPRPQGVCPSSAPQAASLLKTFPLLFLSAEGWMFP